MVNIQIEGIDIIRRATKIGNSVAVTIPPNFRIKPGDLVGLNVIPLEIIKRDQKLNKAEVSAGNNPS